MATKYKKLCRILGHYYTVDNGDFIIAVVCDMCGVIYNFHSISNRWFRAIKRGDPPSYIDAYDWKELEAEQVPSDVATLVQGALKEMGK